MDDIFIKYEYGDFCIVDLHGKSINDAQVELNHVINSVDVNYQYVLVVHGYNSGTSLKNYVRNQFKHNLVTEKINIDAGRTLLRLKERWKSKN